MICALHKIIGLLLVGSLLSLGQMAGAGPYEDGEAAYQRRDYATALRLWRPLADKGDAKAQARLGFMYQVGSGVAQDDEEGMKWYRLAAEQGHAGAQFNLGFSYANGHGVELNYGESVKWLRRAAEQGHGEAQTNLALRYLNGEGVARDRKRAMDWFRKAAEQEDAGAMLRLGWLYEDGEGFPQDYVRAYMWVSLAAALEANTYSRRGMVRERDGATHKMTPAQIERAQEMARTCQESRFKDCGW